MDDNHCFQSQIPVLKVQILLVDDDATTLSIVSSMLKISSRQDTMLQLTVVTVQNPLEALSTLRVNQGLFDLVVSDLHMPEMNGFQFQKRVNEEFKLPVMIMSSDDKEQMMLECLQSGAVLFVVKPLNQNDLRNIWQYAVAAKKGRTSIPEEIESINQLGESSSSSVELQNSISNYSGGEKDNATSMAEDGNDVVNYNKDSNGKKNGKKRDRDDRGDDDEDAPVATKKAKVVWTNSLHNRFLQAINHIGLEKAVPKKILEVMAVPGLSRENVASHLQKYRLFLKRVAEKGDYSMRSFSERSLRSNFPTGPSFDFQNLQANFPRFTPPQEPFHPGIRGNISDNSNHATSCFPLQEPLRTNSIATRCSFGQPRFLGMSSGFQQALFGNSNTANQQAEHSGFQSNSPRTNMFPQGSMPYSLMNGANNGTMNSATNNGMVNNNTTPTQANQRLQGRSSFSKFDSLRIGNNSTSYVSGFGNIGAVNNTSNGHPGGMEQMQVNGNQQSNGFNSVKNPFGFGFMNRNFNNNVEPTNANFGNYSSSRISGSIRSGNENQMPQTFNGFDQSNASSHQQQQQFGPTNGSGQNANNNQNQQQTGGVTKSLFNSNNNLQRGMALGVQNTSIPSSSNYNVQLNNLGKLQGGEQAANHSFVSNKNSDDDYRPTIEEQSVEKLVDSELADIFPVDNSPLGENWGNDFMDTLFDLGYPI